MTKLWDKGIGLNKEIEKFTVGNDYILDQKLVKYDAKASIAHAKMLAKIGILTSSELARLESGLREIINIAEAGEFAISPEEEDCHTAIENFLVKKAGEAGKKIHTARSRNDQVLAAIRLYAKAEILAICKLIGNLISAVEGFEKKHGQVKIPGYTHMQRAMPSSTGLWAGAFREALQDDVKIIEASEAAINQSPLGSAAGYGVPIISIDRKYVADQLGFAKVQENTLYVQNSRGKFELLVLQSIQQAMIDLNKMVSDIMLFSTSEFGYLTLPKDFCTGSSIMPQKKNLDVAELLRAKTAMFPCFGHQIENIIADLPSGYNRDLQLTKQPFIEGIETAKSCLSVAEMVVANLQVNKDRCSAAMAGKEIFATEEAYRLVKKGMPFREAYKAIGERFSK
jgi:argininosuccinate lyase